MINDTHDGKEIAKLPVARIQDVLLTRLVVRQEAIRLGFAATALTQMATAVSEITRNVVQHSGSPGHVRIFEVNGSNRRGLKIIVEDHGVGIADIEAVFAGTAMGAGIPGCHKLMDDFEIESTVGVGTTVTMTKWLPRS
jgi:serine/threonine-protein kinase RsbT